MNLLPNVPGFIKKRRRLRTFGRLRIPIRLTFWLGAVARGTVFCLKRLNFYSIAVV